MIEPTYFSTFEEFDKNLELVKKEFKQDLPLWQHLWFYRYLQISPVYWLAHLNTGIRKGDLNTYLKIIDSMEPIDQIDTPVHIANIYTTYQAFGDVWNIDFARWWYTRARYQFKPNLIPKPDIFEFYKLLPNKTCSEESILKVFKQFYKSTIKEPIYPTMLALAIPVRATKKQTMKLFSDYLDQYVEFNPKDLEKGNYAIHKSKIREKTIMDCFKVYELAMQQDVRDLFSLGIEADVLDGAIADYKTSLKLNRPMKSPESLRSGTSRQILTAEILAENAAAGKFPCIDPPKFRRRLAVNHIRGLFKYLISQTKQSRYKKQELIKFAQKTKNLTNPKGHYLVREDDKKWNIKHMM